MPEERDGGFGHLQDLLALLGLDEDVRESLAEQAQEKIRDTGVSIAAAVVESMAQSMLYGVLFLLSFAGDDDPAAAADRGPWTWC